MLEILALCYFVCFLLLYSKKCLCKKRSRQETLHINWKTTGLSTQSPLRALALVQPVRATFLHPCFLQPPCLQTMWTFPQPKMSAGWEQPLLGLGSVAGMGYLIVSLRTMATLCGQEEGLMKELFFFFFGCLRALCQRGLREMNCSFFLPRVGVPGSEWTPCEHGTPGSVGCQRQRPREWAVGMVFVQTHQLKYLMKIKASFFFFNYW